MTTRSDLDRPAAVFTAVVGVVLIAASLPFLLFNDDGKERYDLTWTQITDTEGTNQFGGNGQDRTVTVNAAGLLSNVTVTIDCTDNAGIDAAATVAWSLTKDGKAYADGAADCSQDEVTTVALHGHSDKGSLRAKSADAAQADAYDDAQYPNATHQFVLTFRYDRSTTLPLPLPIGGSSFSGTMGLRVDEWRVAANEHDQEATK